MRIAWKDFEVFLLALALCAPASAATYEVAQQHPQALDDGPGTPERRWETFTAAAQKVHPGDVVVIRGGVYRERVLVKAGGTPDKPIRFVAAPGEHVLLTGGDRLTGWHRADAERHIYRVNWPHRFITWNQSMTHPDDEYHRIIGNGFATTAGAWGAQAGISLSSSPGSVIAQRRFGQSRRLQLSRAVAHDPKD